jgi:hypothetical protein
MAGSVIDYLTSNKEWIFSGIGVVLLLGIYRFLMSRKEESSTSLATTPVSNTNTTVVNVQSTPLQGTPDERGDNLGAAKERTRILFIDDDTTFSVVKILKQAGWTQTKIIKDVRSLDDPDIKTASIFFVDIQGVGKALKFADQGLGLARALKHKYPEKWLVIYSAEPKGDVFHQAFRIADDRISKTADPYEFQTIVETFARTRS